MSTQDSTPADTARQMRPPFFMYSKDDNPDGVKDWRAVPLPTTPAEAAAEEEESVPKVDSAQEPVVLRDFPKLPERTQLETPVLPPADKGSGQPKAVAPGKPGSSKTLTTPGS
jgi:hypothetical protein